MNRKLLVQYQSIQSRLKYLLIWNTYKHKVSTWILEKRTKKEKIKIIQNRIIEHDCTLASGWLCSNYTQLEYLSHSFALQGCGVQKNCFDVLRASIVVNKTATLQWRSSIWQIQIHFQKEAEIATFFLSLIWFKVTNAHFAFLYFTVFTKYDTSGTFLSFRQFHAN